MSLLTSQNNPNTGSTLGEFKPKRLSLCVAILSCSLSQSLWALGLGEIQSNSLLGEQLRARIAVIGDHQKLTASEVKVSRVGAAEAESLGIDLMSDGRGIQVRATNTQQGIALDVSSRQTIHEPFLNFVIKLQWPSGSVYREYTLLLDLPVAPVQLGAVQGPSKDRTSSSLNRRAQAKPSSQSYRVQMGDSLLLLAEKWLLNHGDLATGASLETVAQWLMDNNPHAFAAGNANQLMAGALLTWPKHPFDDQRVARSVNQNTASPQHKSAEGKGESVPVEASPANLFTVGGEEAFIHTHRHTLAGLSLKGDQWKLVAAPQSIAPLSSQSQSQTQPNLQARSSQQPLATDAPLLASDPQTNSMRLHTSPMRLRLGAAPTPLGDTSEEGIRQSLAAVVQSQLDVTHEVIDRLRRDNADLRQKLKRLEQSEYLTTLTELVRLQGLQLGELQVQQSLALQNQVELAENAVAGAPARTVTAATVTETVLETPQEIPQETVSVSSMASIMSEVNAAGLVAFAPAAHGGLLQAGKVAGPNSISRIDRAITIAGKAPAAASAIGANSFWRWAMGLLAPLMLMGVYLLVVLRRQNQAADSDARARQSHSTNAFDSDAFSLESFSELTLAKFKVADHASGGSPDNSSHATDGSLATHAFHLRGKDLSAELVTDTNELLDRQTMAELLEQSLEAPDEQQPDLSHNLLLADTLDSDLDDAFGHAMAEIFGAQSLARQSPKEAANRSLAASSPEAALPEEIASEFQADNVIPFERPRHSDDELKRRIHDKVCGYLPPKPEEASYIVTEGAENIEQYLNIEMIDAPKVDLDESRKETFENPQKD